MSQTYSATVPNPQPWQAGTEGSPPRPLYWSCARCRKADAPIAGYFTADPTGQRFLSILIRTTTDEHGSPYHAPAMFCPDCWPLELAEAEARAKQPQED